MSPPYRLTARGPGQYEVTVDGHRVGLVRQVEHGTASWWRAYAVGTHDPQHYPSRDAAVAGLLGEPSTFTPPP